MYIYLRKYVFEHMHVMANYVRVRVRVCAYAYLYVFVILLKHFWAMHTSDNFLFVFSLSFAHIHNFSSSHLSF